MIARPIWRGMGLLAQVCVLWGIWLDSAVRAAAAEIHTLNLDSLQGSFTEAASLEQIDNRAAAGAKLWGSGTERTGQYFTDADAVFIGEFATRLAYWLGQQHSRDQAADQLIEGFKPVIGLESEEMDQAIAKAKENSPLSPVPAATTRRAVVIRSFLVQVSPFLLDEVRRSKETSVSAARSYCEAALKRSITYRLLGSRLKTVTAADASHSRALESLETEFDEVSNASAFNPKTQKKFPADVKAILRLEPRLRTALNGILRTSAPKVQTPTRDLVVIAGSDSPTLVAGESRDVITFEATRMPGDEGKFSIEFFRELSVAARHGEGVEQTAKRYPVGFSIVGARVNAIGRLVLPDEKVKYPARFDDDELRKFFQELGLPLWVIPRTDQMRSNVTVKLSPDFAELTLSGKLTFPGFHIFGQAVSGLEQDFSVKLPVKNYKSNVAQVARTALSESLDVFKTKITDAVREKIKGRLTRFSTEVDISPLSSATQFAVLVKVSAIDGAKEELLRFLIAVSCDTERGLADTPRITSVIANPALFGLLRERAQTLIKNAVSSTSDTFLSAIRIGDITPMLSADKIGVESIVSFKLPGLDDYIPNFPISFHFDGAGELITVDESSWQSWRSWAQQSVSKIEQRLNSVIDVGTQGTLAGLRDAGPFAIAPAWGLWGRVVGEPKYEPDHKYYDIGLELTVAANGKAPDWKELMRLTHVHLTKVELHDGKITAPPELRLDQAKLEPGFNPNRWMTPLLDLPSTALQIVDVSLCRGILTFSISVNFAEAGIVFNTEHVEINLTQPNLDIGAIVQGAISTKLVPLLNERLKEVPSIGPIEKVVLGKETHFNKDGIEVWIEGDVKVGGDIGLRISARLFPSIQLGLLQKTVVEDILKTVGNRLSLNGEGLPLEKFELVKPCALNLDATIGVLGCNAKLVGIKLRPGGIDLPGEVWVTSPEFSQTINTFLKPYGTATLANVSIMVSLKTIGVIGLRGELTGIQEEFAKFAKLSAEMRVDLSAIDRLAFTYEGQLVILTTIPLFSMDGELSLAKGRATARAGSEGPLKAVFDFNQEATLDFRDFWYDQKTNVAVFGLRLGRSQMHIALKDLLLTTEGLVDLNVFGSGSGGLTLNLSQTDQCNLHLKVNVPVSGFSLDRAELDVNAQRALLTFNVLGIDCSIVQPTADVFTQHLIEDYLRSLFKLQLPELEDLLKNKKITISPKSGGGGNSPDSPGDPALQAHTQPGPPSIGGVKPSTNEKQQEPAQTVSSDNNSMDRPSIEGTKRVESKPLKKFLQGKDKEFIPESVNSAGRVHYFWGDQEDGASLAILRVGASDVYLGRYLLDDTAAANDTREPEKAALTFSVLFPRIGPEIAAIPMNRKILNAAVSGSVGGHDLKYHITGIASNASIPNVRPLLAIKRFVTEEGNEAATIYRASSVSDSPLEVQLDATSYPLLTDWLQGKNRFFTFSCGNSRKG